MKKEYKNFHLIEVRYFGPTNTRGSRVKMIDSRFDQVKTIPYDYQENSAVDIAIKWLVEHGHIVVGKGAVGGNDVVVLDADKDSLFKPLV